jgi:hypothetical protein
LGLEKRFVWVASEEARQSGVQALGLGFGQAEEARKGTLPIFEGDLRGRIRIAFGNLANLIERNVAGEERLDVCDFEGFPVQPKASAPFRHREKLSVVYADH